jgi:LysR family cys regulon transcriptional activator
MNFEQLRYFVAVVEHSFSASTAARQLGCSQPAVSRQIQLLERELGFNVLDRVGRAYTGITPEGRAVLRRASNVLQHAQALRHHAENQRAPAAGTLAIATTHTQARYVLPDAVARFRGCYPAVTLRLHAGPAEQSVDYALGGRADLAIATGDPPDAAGLLRLPCYRWAFRAVVTPEHPLANVRRLTLAQLAEHPLVTYTFSLHGRASLLAVFEAARLRARIAMTAADAEVIKTYVRHGLGVGLVAAMAVDPVRDADLIAIDASPLLEPKLTWIGFRRDAVLRDYAYDFIETCAPHLPRRLVDEVRLLDTPAEVDHVLEDLHVPLHA